MEGLFVKLVRILGIVLCLVILSSCSASQSSSGEESSITPRVPSEGQSLERRGVKNPQAGLILLPEGTELVHLADQPNLIIAVGIESQAEEVRTYLMSTLPDLGWTITSSGEKAIVFSSSSWRGAYVEGSQSWALTIRND